jgi:hypothetical protein
MPGPEQHDLPYDIELISQYPHDALRLCLDSQAQKEKRSMPSQLTHPSDNVWIASEHRTKMLVHRIKYPAT